MCVLMEVCMLWFTPSHSPSFTKIFEEHRCHLFFSQLTAEQSGSKKLLPPSAANSHGQQHENHLHQDSFQLLQLHTFQKFPANSIVLKVISRHFSNFQTV